MIKTKLIEQLRRKRSILLKAYIIHLGWFTSTIVSAVTESIQLSLPTLLLFTMITIPPVLVYTVMVHKACRAIDPTANSAGLLPVILFTIILTPLESGLILPLKNLLVAGQILRASEEYLERKNNLNS